MAVSLMCLRDQRGKEVYFDEDSNEVSFETGMAIKQIHPNWTMQTEDWGYFPRAFNDVLNLNDKSMWKKYDVYIAIACTSGITGLIWFIAGLIEISKFRGAKWNLASLGLSMCSISLAIFIAVNVFIFYRICMTLLIKTNHKR